MPPGSFALREGSLLLGLLGLNKRLEGAIEDHVRPALSDSPGGLAECRFDAVVIGSVRIGEVTGDGMTKENDAHVLGFAEAVETLQERNPELVGADLLPAAKGIKAFLAPVVLALGFANLLVGQAFGAIGQIEHEGL